MLDIFDAAIEVALENAAANGVRDRMSVLTPGADIVPLEDNQRVDVLISNPAQLPLPEPEQENSPYYAEPEGRAMIDLVIQAAPRRLKPGGRLYMTHNSLTNIPKSVAMMDGLGLRNRMLESMQIAFRPFIDRPRLDSIGGAPAGLYEVCDGAPYETVKVIEATMP